MPSSPAAEPPADATRPARGVRAGGAAPGAPAGGDGGFVKALTLTDATMLVAGSMIGSGIFIVSADIARTLRSPALLLAAWGLTGVITLLGALAYGELAAMYPRAGGQYVFLREAMGPVMGFLYGWTLFVVIQTGHDRGGGGRRSASSSACSSRASRPTASRGSRRPTCARLARLPRRRRRRPCSWAHAAAPRGAADGVAAHGREPARRARGEGGADAGSRLVKTARSRCSSCSASRSAATRRPSPANFGAGNFAPSVSFAAPFAVVFGSALVGSLFSSDAWNNVTFAAAEVQNPRRNLPLALVLGTGLVTLLYVLANVSYLAVLPLAGTPDGATALARGVAHATQDRVGTAVAEVMFGPGAVTAMAVAILVSTFGCNNGLILAGARVYWAMARDGLFFRKAGTLNGRGVPAFALVAQAVWTTLLCLTGTYGQLLDYVIFAALVFYALTTVGLFVLRRTRPDAERPYRAVGYPVLPALYIALSAGTAVILLLADKTRIQAVSGLVLVLLGLPVYALWRAAAGPGAAAR
jgi:APA family basic amino acid/polyamine antiporter